MKAALYNSFINHSTHGTEFALLLLQHLVQKLLPVLVDLSRPDVDDFRTDTDLSRNPQLSFCDLLPIVLREKLHFTNPTPPKKNESKVQMLQPLCCAWQTEDVLNFVYASFLCFLSPDAFYIPLAASSECNFNFGAEAAFVNEEGS